MKWSEWPAGKERKGEEKENKKQVTCSLYDGRSDPELQSSSPKFTFKVLFASTMHILVAKTYKTIKNYSISSLVNAPLLQRGLRFSGMEFRNKENNHFSWIFLMWKLNACPWSVKKGTTWDRASLSPGWHRHHCALEFPYRTKATRLQKLYKTSSHWICYTNLYWQFQLILYWNIAVGLDTIVWGADVFNMISSRYIVIKQRGGNMKESYSILLKQILHFERKTKDLICYLLGHLCQHNYFTCAN